MKQPSQSNSKKHPTTALACHLTALAGFFMLSVSNIQAAAIQVSVYPSSGSAINSASNSTLSSGVAYVGTFFDGSSPMSKSVIASLWDATRAGYEALYSKFVSVGSALVSGGTFSINTSAEVDSVGGKSLVGKNVYVLVVDNSSSPNGFLLLAADGDGGTTFANPRETFGDNFTDLEISGKLKTYQFENLETGVTESIEAPATTSVVGSAGSYSSSTDRWALVSIPASSSTLTLNGFPTVTHYWGSSYTDAGVTPSSGVTTVIRNASNQVIADFAAMSNTLGTYTITYTSGSSSTTRTVNVKIQNPSADSDKDGLSNLMEYLLGGSLTANDSAKLPTATVSGTELILTFTARSDVTSATPVALAFLTTTSLSSAFAPETLSPKTEVPQSGVPSGLTKQQWSFSIVGLSKKFARLQVTVPAELSEGS
jgi:hypothetical protein